MSAYAAKRTLRRDGVEVDVYQFETGERTSRGRPTSLTDDSPRTVKMIPDPGGKSVAYGTFGVEVDADMVYLAHEDEAVDGGGGDGATRLVQHGDVVVVLDADRTQLHGFQILECERDQTYTVADLEAEATDNGGDGS